MTDYREVKTAVWDKERLERHLKDIGAEHPPAPPNKGHTSVTAPKQVNGSGKYVRRGGEW
ncbi:hypothetical protein [Paenibacillus massiliensis]|uniref:hypothetical protein n=1 Tax=Paenibacillus massiliensis TaxID=225917 RepID=UPI00041B08F0|nr:hypothetical protein [Paenibacillus massiliensis]